MSVRTAELFKHNLWANLALLAACESLADAALDSSVAGTYGTVRDTLMHLLGAEERYAGLLTQADPGPALEKTSWPGIAGLRDHATRSGEALIRLAESLPGDFTRRDVWQKRTYETDGNVVLVQAINHATEHRAQIVTTLSANGVEPVDLSGWTWGEAADGVRDVGPA